MVGVLGKKNLTSSSASSFYLGFSFSITCSSSPISLPPDIVCVVFVAVLVFFVGAGGVGNINFCSLLKKDKLGGRLVGGGGSGKGGDGGLLLLNKSLKFGG